MGAFQDGFDSGWGGGAISGLLPGVGFGVDKVH